MVTQRWCWPARSQDQGLGQGFPGLVLDHWLVDLGHRVSGCRALGFLKLVSASLVSVAGSWGHLLRGPRCLSAELACLWSVRALGAPWESASLLVCVLILDKSGCGAVMVLVMVTTHWWEGLGAGNPTALLVHWWMELGLTASASPLAGRAGAWGLWLHGPGVPELVLNYLCG